MPIHDWTRVEAGTFHGFHMRWLVHLQEHLNENLLPKGYYADAEQITRPMEADVLTLSVPPTLFSPLPVAGGVCLADRPLATRRQLRLRFPTVAPIRQRRLVVRHVTGHRVVALIEILSPANKDRAGHVEAFVAKTVAALQQGVHVLLLDVFPPGRHDPTGLPGAISAELRAADDDEAAAPVVEVPLDEPLTFAAYAAGDDVQAFIEYRAVGAELPEMPLFLSSENYVTVPLAESYARAWHGTPEVWRDILQPPTA